MLKLVGRWKEERGMKQNSSFEILSFNYLQFPCTNGKSDFDWMKLLQSPEWKYTRGYRCQRSITNGSVGKLVNRHGLGWQADLILVDNLCLDWAHSWLFGFYWDHVWSSYWQQVSVTTSSHLVAVATQALPIVEVEFRTASPDPCNAKHGDTSLSLLT